MNQKLLESENKELLLLLFKYEWYLFLNYHKSKRKEFLLLLFERLIKINFEKD